MCRLFIVEDEEILREGIQNNIDWFSNQVEIVGTAANGKECLEKIETCMPEVILSDIKMPFMNGMELIEQLYQLYPKIKIVLLTAFDEFEYAKKALNYKVCEYVMKSEENEKILQAVLKAGNEYTKSINQIERVRQSEVLLEKKILIDLLFYEDKSEQLKQNILDSSIEFLYDDFFVTSILSKNISQSKDVKNLAEKYDLLQQNISKLDCGINLYFCKNEQKLCVIANFDGRHLNIFDKFIGMLDVLLNEKEDEWSCKLKAMVGNVYKGIDGISKSYDEASYMMSLYQTTPYYDEGDKNVTINNNMNSSGCAQKKTVNQIVDYIRSHYQEENICLDQIAKKVHLTPAYVSAMFKKEKKINISDYIIKMRIERAKNLLMSTDMKTYEISEDIGYVNSQYFSVLFKRNIGVSPTEYRQRAKIK